MITPKIQTLGKEHLLLSATSYTSYDLANHKQHLQRTITTDGHSDKPKHLTTTSKTTTTTAAAAAAAAAGAVDRRTCSSGRRWTGAGAGAGVGAGSVTQLSSTTIKMLSQRYAKSAAAQTSAAIALQILLRIITFASNAFIVRFASHSVLGVINVRLMLLYSTTVFLSREPLRRACLSVSMNILTRPYWKQIVNLIWIG
eukprot:gene11230-3278_t